MRRSLGLALMLLLAVGDGFTAPASAQIEPYTPTNSRLLREPDKLSPDTVRRLQKIFAACVYRGESELAVKLLRNSDPASIDYKGFGVTEADISERFHMPRCLGQAMTSNLSEAALNVSAKILRTSLAEEAYLAAGKPVTIGDGAEEILSNRHFVTANDSNVKAIAAFSDCVVFHAPEQADTLVRTDPASPDETKAVQALVPALSACLVAGREMELTIPVIRSIVADGLWSRSDLSQQAPAEATK